VNGVEDPDHALMQRIASGDARAFRQLSDQHLKTIVTYAYRITHNRAEAEEIAQEVFLRTWREAERYRPEGRVVAWLHKVAQRLALDLLRRRRGTVAVDEALEAPASDNPQQLLVRKQNVQGVQAALQLLPERQRLALVLSHEQGLSNSETADVLGLGVDATESLLARARRSLRQLLTQANPESEGQRTQ
jgi:RNA polymerase sigma-70 factor (ECF subfamily)